MMIRRSILAPLLGVVTLLVLASRVTAQREKGAAIAGTIVGPEGASPATVEITSYADRACVDLAGKRDPSADEKNWLAACRKERAFSATADGAGTFDVKGLTNGWYSVTLTWTSSTAPRCPRMFMGEWFGSNYRRTDGTWAILAIGEPFDVADSVAVRKDFTWCQ